MSSDTARVDLHRAVQAAGVSLRTLYNWMTAGRLPFTVAFARTRYVSVADVLTLKSHSRVLRGR